LIKIKNIIRSRMTKTWSLVYKEPNNIRQHGNEQTNIWRRTRRNKTRTIRKKINSRRDKNNSEIKIKNTKKERNRIEKNRRSKRRSNTEKSGRT